MKTFLPFHCFIFTSLIDATVENCLSGPDTGELLDTPRILQEVQTTRSAELKLESLNKLGRELLADLPGYEEISSRVTSALKDIEIKRQHFVHTWVILQFKNQICHNDNHCC